jgi:hypothetical protein
MARRKDYSARSAKRKIAPQLKRSENRYKQRLLVLLACEGKNTERLYFEAFFAILKARSTISPASCVFAPHQHTNPTGVLEDLLSRKNTTFQVFQPVGVAFWHLQKRSRFIAHFPSPRAAISSFLSSSRTLFNSFTT